MNQPIFTPWRITIVFFAMALLSLGQPGQTDAYTTYDFTVTHSLTQVERVISPSGIPTSTAMVVCRPLK